MNQSVAMQPYVNQAFIRRVSFIAGLGGILYGFDMGVIAAALIYVRDAFHLSTWMQEVLVIAVLIGVMIGALIGGTVADRVGRRKTLVWGGILFIAGSILAPLSPDVYVLFIARTLLGIAVGFTSVTAPVYVSELAPPQSRGMLIGLYQFALTSGIALADLVGYWFAASHGWRWMFAFGLLPALLFLFMVLTVPESPRWLFAQNRVEEAELVLKSYTDEAGARVLLEDIRLSLMTKMERRWSALWSPAVRGSLFIAVGFMLLVPATGINAVLYYGPQIFSLAGISSDKSAIFATFLVAITNVLATVIALVLVDRAGRKPLLFAGLGGMTVALLMLAVCFHNQAALGHSLGLIATSCLMFFITCYAFSLGPIAWILVSEVFPLRLRGRGVAAATLSFGTSNFIVSLTFLSLLKAAGTSLTFVLYGGFCILTLIFVRYVIPETKGRELESISARPTAVAP
ncbi:MAG TPA: sugar porter family MFS transporter [Acidobacteriaceae bacterium]|nr:sugar porter family MFS transporter [Acidobacteriaceae bacterium]